MVHLEEPRAHWLPGIVTVALNSIMVIQSDNQEVELWVLECLHPTFPSLLRSI